MPGVLATLTWCSGDFADGSVSWGPWLGSTGARWDRPAFPEEGASGAGLQAPACRQSTHARDL